MSKNDNYYCEAMINVVVLKLQILDQSITAYYVFTDPLQSQHQLDLAE
jgi:hypothetical protein